MKKIEIDLNQIYFVQVRFGNVFVKNVDCVEFSLAQKTSHFNSVDKNGRR